MREFLIGVGAVAAGVLVAAFILIGTWHVVRPAPNISIDLVEYACGTDGKKVECSRR